MRATLNHWPDRPREIKPIVPKTHPEAGHGVSVTVSGTETIDITSTDPAFLEELEGAVREARQRLEARPNLKAVG